MAEQLYNKYADIPALEKQTKQILGMFAQVEAGVVKLKDLGININSSKSVGETKKLTDEFDHQNETIRKQQQELVKMAQKLAALTTEEAKQAEALRQVTGLIKQKTAEEIKSQTVRQAEYADLKKLKLANAEVAKDVELRIKLNRARAGSEEELALKYQKAQRILARQAPEQRDSARGQNLAKFAAETKKQLDQLQQKLGNFRGNVGNYTKSLEGLFEGVANEIKRLKAEQDKVTQRTVVQGFVTKEDQQQIDQFTASIGELNDVMAIGTQEGASYDKIVKQLGKSYSNLASSGNQSRTFIQGFKVDVAQAKDSAQDLKDEIKALSSDTRKLDLAAGAIGTLASGFEVATGAAALFGAEQEDIQKSIQKLVAIQSVANGIRQIATDLTKHGTAANKLYNGVIEQGTILFGKGSTAAQRFGAALKGIIVIAVVTVIFQLVEALSSVEDKAEDAQKATKKFNDELERTKKIASDLAGSDLQDFNRRIEDIKRLNAERLKGVTDDKKVASITKENQKRLFDEEVRFRQDQLAKLRIQQENAADDEIRQEQRKNSFMRALQAQGVKTISKERAAAYDEAIQKAKEYNQELKDAVRNGQRDLINFQDQYNTKLIEEDVDAYNKRIEKAKEATDAEKDAAAELFRYRQGLIKEQNDLFSSAESPLSTDAKLKAAQEAADAEIAILESQREEDLRHEKTYGAKRTLINEKADNDILDSRLRLESKLIQIRIAGLQNEKQIAKEASDAFDAEMQERLETQISASEKALANELKRLEKEKQEELRVAAENNLAGLTTAEQYAKKKEQIELDYQRKILNSQIQFFEDQLKILEVGSDKYIEVEAALAAARAALAEGRLVANQKVIDQEKEQLKQIQDNYVAAAKAVSDTVVNVYGAIAERRKTQLQEEINMIEERKAREIEAINASGDSEEKKAARIKIIEAKAQADREALERRQRQIERQRAIVERSLKAFTIVTDTITATNAIRLEIAKAPPATKPLWVSQLVLAIASGAASLTALLAAPLPKLAKGTKSSQEGLHELAEQGMEMGIEPSGKIKIWKDRTIDYLKKGTVVLNNKQTVETLKSIRNISEMVRTNKVLENDKLVNHDIDRVNEFIKNKTVNMQLLTYDSVANSSRQSQTIKNLNNITSLISNSTKVNTVDEIIRSKRSDKVQELTKSIQKIKGYFTGVKSSPEGLARVAERGREIGITPEKKIVLWEKPTLAFLSQGTKILPNKVTEDIINNTKIDLINRNDRMLHKDSDFGEQILKELQKKKEPKIYVYNNQNIESSIYYQQQIKR